MLGVSDKPVVRPPRRKSVQRKVVVQTSVAVGLGLLALALVVWAAPIRKAARTVTLEDDPNRQLITNWMDANLSTFEIVEWYEPARCRNRGDGRQYRAYRVVYRSRLFGTWVTTDSTFVIGDEGIVATHATEKVNMFYEF